MDQRRSVAWALVTCTALLVLLIAILPIASGQSMTGQISGIVQDPQSAVVPGATVTLTNVITGQERQVTSGSQGGFLFTQLLAGEYMIRVNVPGFKVYEQKGLNLSSNENLVARGVKLELGTTSETVEVSAEMGRIETQSSERAGLITTTQIQDLAVSPDRNFMNLLKVVPGVTVSSRWGATSATVLGGRSGQTIVTLDGIVDNDTGLQVTGPGWVQPNIDAISEMKVMLTNYTAEYGVRSGGTINVAIKNGTRDFHGSSYYFKRHEMFNANDWNNNRNNRPKARYRYDNFGATFGGPVIFPGTSFNQSREKLFFFLSLEWLKNKEPSGVRRVRYPTALEREGDFSQTFKPDNVTLYTVTDPNTDEQFVDNGVLNKIPSSRGDAVGKGFLNFFPLPNRTDWSDGDNTYNWLGEWLTENPRNEQIFRIDWNVAPKTLIYGRFVRTSNPMKNPIGRTSVKDGHPLLGTTWWVHSLGIVTTWIQTFSPSLVNEATFGFNRGMQDQAPFEGQLERVVRTNLDGIKEFQQFHPEINPMNIMPGAAFGVGNWDVLVDQRFLFHGNNTLMNVTNNLSWVKGSHSLKSGFYFEFTSRNSVRSSVMSGFFDFSPDQYNIYDTGLGMANAFIGTVRTYQESDRAQYSQARYRDIEFYLQDSWRATRRLTLDIGVRFQNLWPTWLDGQQVGMFEISRYSESTAMRLIEPAENKMGKNPYTGELVPPTLIESFAMPAGVTLTPEEMYPAVGVFDETYLNNPGWNVSPRIGFAFDAFGDGKMAIRGGFGMFYERSGGDDVQGNWLQVPPIQNLATIWYSTVSQLKSATFTYTPASGIYAPSAAQRDFDTPGSYNWSLGIQRDLGLGVVLDVSYVGTVGRHLRRSKGINSLLYGTRFDPDNINPARNQVWPDNFLRPYRGYSGILYVSYDDNSNYHSMQVQLNRRFGERLTMGGFWTWSKVLDYSSGGGNPFIAPQANFLPDKLYYGNASSDRTHNIVVNWTYRIPGLSSRMGDNTIARGVFDGWQMSGIATFTSGAPLAVSWRIADPRIDTTGSDVNITRIDIIGNPIDDTRKTCIWSNVNTSAFAPPKYGSAYCDYTTHDIYKCGVGNASKNFFRGPGTNNWDISFFKNFQLGSDENRSLQFRFETYNTFNHTQYSGIDTNAIFNSAGEQISQTFGQYNNTASARRMVFALKLKF